MFILIVAIVSLALDALTYVPALNWFSLVGFTMGIIAWVIGRKVYQTQPGAKYAKLSMILGGIGTFAGLVGILTAFVLGTLLFGGFVVF